MASYAILERLVVAAIADNQANAGPPIIAIRMTEVEARMVVREFAPFLEGPQPDWSKVYPTAYHGVAIDVVDPLMIEAAGRLVYAEP